MTSAIPVLDLREFTSGSLSEQQSLARRLDAAYRDIGFITIVGHGVARDLLDRMWGVTRAFFALPDADKARVTSRVRDGQFCGFVPFAADAAAHTYRGADTPPDLRARFRMVKPTCAAVLEKVGPNQWPTALPELEHVWNEYYAAMERLGATLMRLCAAALSLPQDFFVPYYEEHFSVLMATHSPPQREKPLTGQLRCGEHTDNGTLTMVLQSDSPGSLEVQRVSGEWITVPPVAGAYVVNIGDLLARWTNDRWVSTVHRVGNPPPGLRATEPRQSIVFFHQPCLDQTIRCLPTCEGGLAKYEPITLREHFSRQQKKLSTRDASLTAAR